MYLLDVQSFSKELRYLLINLLYLDCIGMQDTGSLHKVVLGRIFRVVYVTKKLR